MNIFDVLSQGKSRLHEPAISATVGYLLGSHRDHGLGDSFVRSFLQLVQSQTSVGFIGPILGRPFIDTDVSLEEPYQLGTSRKDIDIQLSVFDSDRHEDLRIIIENKIKVGAANPKQLWDYYQAVLQDDDTIANLLVVFITPKATSLALKQEFEGVKTLNGHDKAWLYWNDEELGVLQIIQNLLERELRGDITPINEYMRHTLKAFVLHVRSVVDTDNGKRRPPGVDIGEIVDSVDVDSPDGKRYRIVRRNSQQIQVFLDEEKTTAKPVLRDLIEQYQFDIPLAGINTRQMGKMVIDRIKELDASRSK